MTSLQLPGFESISVAASVTYRDGRRVALAETGPLHFSTDGLSLHLHHDISRDAHLLTPRINGNLSALDSLHLKLHLPAKSFSRIYSARREIWLPTGLRTADLRPLPDGPPERTETPVTGDVNYDFHADNLIALYTPAGRTFLAGVRYPGRHGYEMRVRGDTLDITYRLESTPSPTTLDALFLLADTDLTAALQRYGHFNRITHRSPYDRATMVAWNSWDYYESHVTQSDMLAAARAIAADPLLKKHITAIVLDDGWATHNGDWEPNPATFPDLAGMAREIASLGFTPGIWYAPFRVSRDCAFVRENPDTCLWGDSRNFYRWPFTPEAKIRVLDPTHPKVLAKIDADLRRLRAMGFRYYKTDFLQAVNTNFLRPKWHDNAQTPVEAVRRAMHVIRGAIGHDSYWLACGTEFLPVAGLADAARISDDITERFSTLQVAVRHCAQYFWANGNLWLTDPDFLVLRGPETTTSPHMHKRSELGNPRPESPYVRNHLNTGPYFTLEQARTWANFHIVYGGVLAWADVPGQLNEAGRAFLKKVLEWHEPSAPGVPLDLAEHNLPRLWLRPARNGYLVGLFNFDDSSATLSFTDHPVAKAAKRITNIWTGELLPSLDNIALPPHHSRVFHLETE